MTKLLPIFAVILLVIACGSQKPVQPAKTATETTTPPPAPVATAPESAAPATPPPAATPSAEVKGNLKDTLTADKLPQNLFITFKVRDYGSVKIKFYTKDAPKNVTNVANLAIKGFYNGLTFHRIVPGFVVQGGDPKGDGTGGPGYSIRCEVGPTPYRRGAVGMALSGPDTGGSQFFLMHSRHPHLDGRYTLFAQIVAGQEVVDAIVPGDVLTSVTIE